MGEELCSIRMVIDMMESGSRANDREKDVSSMPMKTSMRVNGMKEREMGMECLPRGVEITLKAIG